MELTTQELNAWSTNVFVLGMGAEGEAVAMLQRILEAVDASLYTGLVDGDFGKLTRSAVMRYQELRLLTEDGITGPITKADLVEAYSSDWFPAKSFQHPLYKVQVYGARHPSLGMIPDSILGKTESGKISTFGGPDDKGDRIYGQAYVSGASSPKALWERHPKLVEMGVLRKDIARLDKYPSVTDWRDLEHKASTSWALNPNSYYIAMRWAIAGRSMGYMNANNPRLLVWSEETNKAVVCLRTDYGPHPRTGRLMDLSNGAMKALGLKTDRIAKVCWTLDDATIGPVK